MESVNSTLNNRQYLEHFLCQSGYINREKAAEIAKIFKPIHIPKNAFLLEENKVSDTYVFLDSGFMRSFTYDTDGNDITTAFHSKHQVVFEVSSFFNRTPSKEIIQAITDCEGWTISFEELNHLFHSIAEFREFGRSILVSGYAGLKNRMLSMINETAEIRYVKLLESKPEIFQYASLKNIATYLGITDTSLSRIRKEYAKK